MADMIVSGAGSSEVNGTYAVIGNEGGKPHYANNANSDIHIGWADKAYWLIVSTTFVYYFSYDDVATPDLCTTWEVVDGEPPVPTVTKEVTGVPKHFLYYARMRGNQ
jgi:hypothetical protein